MKRAHKRLTVAVDLILKRADPVKEVFQDIQIERIKRFDARNYPLEPDLI